MKGGTDYTDNKDMFYKQKMTSLVIRKIKQFVARRPKIVFRRLV